MALKKAEVHIIGEKKTEKIKVLFNPNEYKITNTKKYKWIQPVGAEAPVKQYVGSEVPQLEVELFFDTYATPEPESKKKDVRKFTEKIERRTSNAQRQTSKHPHWTLEVQCSTLDVQEGFEYRSNSKSHVTDPISR